MWFEGTCMANQVPIVFKNALLTPDPSLPTPTPLWEMVSSNVGTTKDDDGYVFKSISTRNGHRTVIGVKSEIDGFDYNSSYWHFGYRYFVAHDYTPNTIAGQNGTFTGLIARCSPILYQPTSVFTNTTTPIKYWISVKADRVILVLKTDIVDSAGRISVLYFGRLKEYFHPLDNGVVLGGSSSYATQLQMTSSGISSQTPQSMSVVLQNQPKHRIWGNKFIVSNILLNSENGYRGYLDMLAIRSDGISLSNLEELVIGNVPHLSILVPYSTTLYTYFTHTRVNNFSQGSYNYHLIIPKD